MAMPPGMPSPWGVLEEQWIKDVLGDGDPFGTVGILRGPGGPVGSGGLLSILREGSLLSTVLGLTGLPGIGIHLNLYTHVALNGKWRVLALLLGLLDVAVEVNNTSRVRLTMDDTGYSRLVTERCDTLLGGIQVRLLRGLLPIVGNLLAGVLNRLLPNLLCLVVDIALGLIKNQLGLVNCGHWAPLEGKELLGSVGGFAPEPSRESLSPISAPGLVPLGMQGSIEYTVSSLPLVTNQFLEAVIGRVAGGLVDHPLGEPGTVPTAPRVPVPLLPPVAATGSSQLGISMNLLSSKLSGFGCWLVFKAYPRSHKLLLEMTAPEAPVVTLKESQGVIQLMATAEVMVNPPGALGLLDIDTSLLAWFPVEDNKLKIRASLKKADLSLVSSSIGGFDVSFLDTLTGQILDVAFVPAVNIKNLPSTSAVCAIRVRKVLGEGVPLARMLSINFSSTDIDVIEVLQICPNVP
ncbi:BPI fold-containing family B member 4 [Ara ararauna]